MSTLDPRLHAYRADLAATSLRDQVSASRYVAGKPAQVVRGVADVRRRPEAAAPLDTQFLCGEQVTVYDEADGWAWAQNAADGYVGYVQSSVLGAEIHAPTHSVAVLRTFLYPEPNIKTPPVDCLSMSSPVTVAGTKDRFSEVRLAKPGAGGWIYSTHLAAPSAVARDHLETARQFLWAPYLWGGKSSLGLDCSALIQIALNRAGIPCPRDSYMQATTVGSPVPFDTHDYTQRRGDLIYFPGHVAIATDETMVLSPNGHAMLVTIEPLADLLGRVHAESGGRGIIAVRRL
ncbi:MAG TPA: NlpC/P60 family protein [Kiloniellales bacterium]|jgi:cell wall-associated NlpC family hydrolase